MSGKIWQGKDITADTTIEADVCIIGSGCGGATLAKQLALAGRTVVVLERGGYYTEADFDQDELNMNGKLSANRSLKSSTDGGTLLLSGNNVGGASVHYWADTYRTPQDRLDHWTQRYGLTGHGAAELSPAWDALDKVLNVHRADEEHHNRMNQLLREGAKKLGWEGNAVPQARKGCVKSGHCMQGCLYAAKQSQLVTHIPQAVAAGANVYADILAEKLTHANGKVSSLACRVMDRATNRPSGHTLNVHAKQFAVAAGGYYSAPFLIANGLQSQLPALGQHFGMNPTAWAFGLYDEDITLWRNIPAAFGVEEFRLARFDAQNRYLEGGYLLMANQVQPGTLAGTMPLMGDEIGEWMGQAHKIGSTIVWLDDYEEELGTIGINADGSPKVDYPYGPVTTAMLRDSMKKQVQVLFATGARKVLLGSGRRVMLDSANDLSAIDQLDITGGGLFMAAPHPFGGCRMGADPKTSVVGMDHRVHGFSNLFVADPSVFPTGPSVDPSFTIMAFSTVAAKHMLAA
ncbi:GMC family oxidoreductase [Curvibacter sp. APW13]|uniref:GMC family oxidoreductase n=1 Tax=Curvibacter sp. APW13 TaxID=3077236 RepID=UPI0028DFFC34|nr:GMC family oxidoreductase [Curvibacter sp. APW13]MDT8989310.1 GMC family oxidoreductase [Curvibacter sp. APW13]